MKTLLLSLIVLTTTQTSWAHPDCIFHHAPIGHGMTKSVGTKSDNAVISATIKAKEKFDNLLNLFNSNRSRNLRVLSAISSESTVENPLLYSPTLIAEELRKLEAQMSEALRNAIFQDNIKPDLSRISESDIIKFGPKLGGLYELAIRYELLIKNKSAYSQRANKDIRGFYYLYNKKVSEQTLANFEQYSPKEQEQIKNALVGICRNSDVKTSRCRKDMENAVKRRTLSAFYKKYYNNAVRVWNSYFQIPESAVRKDISFTNGVLEIPFKMPESKAVHDFVMEIERFWKNREFAIHLDFQGTSNIPNLSFKENSVAHVNKLGGDNIIMNTTIDMRLSNTKKVLNHEFGHVLGLPDCYIEFYDEEQSAFVNYQLNKTDMMCSTSGQLTPRIIQELQRVYGR